MHTCSSLIRRKRMLSEKLEQNHRGAWGSVGFHLGGLSWPVKATVHSLEEISCQNHSVSVTWNKSHHLWALVPAFVKSRELGQLKSKLIGAYEALYDVALAISLGAPPSSCPLCSGHTLSPLTLDKLVPWPLWFALPSIWHAFSASSLQDEIGSFLTCRFQPRQASPDSFS